MKLQRILADNFLRLNLFDVELDDRETVHLFCGDNEAGKSSVQEAIRFALLGETARVTRKSDYKLMIRDGAKEGSVTICIDDQLVQRDVKSGKEADSQDRLYKPPEYIEYVLDAQRFAHLNQDKRRGFLIGLTDTAVKPEDIKKRMLAKGIAEACVDMIMPMLRSGFTATHKEAQNRASEARSRWCGLTGRNRYGSQIAAEWQASPPEESDPDALRGIRDAREQGIAELEQEISGLQLDKGSINNQITVAKDKHPCACASCGAALAIDISRDPVSGKTLYTSTEWSDRDTDKVGELQAKLHDIGNKIHRKQNELLELREDLAVINAKIALATKHEEITATAKGYHLDVQRWEKAVDALAPDGIPAEILSDALTPVNERLRECALQTGWPQVTISPTMEILADNRPYQLLSESARWRADTAIAEAISHLSGLRLLVIDRMDVLDMKNRQAFMKWIHGLIDDYDTVLIFATLKTKPSLPMIKSYWIENGEIVEKDKEAA